jgi:phosphonate transport system substrate-binding protein
MRLLFYFLLCVCFNFACSAQNVLYIGVGSNISKSAESQQVAEELAAYFSQKMGIPVKINSLKPGKTLEQIQEGKLDIALMNTFGYVLASSEGYMEGLVVVANDKKEAISYKSCILANPSTKITNTNELKKEAGKHIFGFVTASSTSGHLVPRLYLNRLDLQPEISFRDVVFAGSHKDLIQKVSTDDIRVGATSYTDEKSIFIPAQNSLYDSIKKMADSMEEINLLVGVIQRIIFGGVDNFLTPLIFYLKIYNFP